MALSLSDIIATVSGVVLLVMGLIWSVIRLVGRFTFSRKQCPLTIGDEENQIFFTSSNLHSGTSAFETIGNLTIPPDRCPLPLALDIINHIGMAIGLPAGAKPVRLKGVPRVSLHLPPPTPITPATKVNIVMAEVEAKAGFLHSRGDAMRNPITSRQEPSVHRRTASQGRKTKDQGHVTSRSREPTVAMEKHDFHLGLQTSLEGPLARIQDVFVIGDSEDDEPGHDHLADSEMASGFGSGKSMAALYHAV